MFKRVGGMMKGKLALLVAFMFTGFTFGLKSVERYYTSTKTVMHCMDYNEVYDARGNLKNSRWYMPFEEKILTDKEFTDQVTDRHITSLVSRRAEKLGEAQKKRLEFGVPTIQFSHQFVTTRPSKAILEKMTKARVPASNDPVRVCRVYHIMEPQKIGRIIQGAPERRPTEVIDFAGSSDDEPGVYYLGSLFEDDEGDEGESSGEEEGDSGDDFEDNPGTVSVANPDDGDDVTFD